MARQSSGGLVVVGLPVAISIAYLAEHPEVAVLIGALVAAVIGAVYLITQETKKGVKRRSEAEIKSIALKHSNTLARKFSQLVYHDDYGNVKYDRYLKEIRYFT